MAGLAPALPGAARSCPQRGDSAGAELGDIWLAFAESEEDSLLASRGHSSTCRLPA